MEIKSTIRWEGKTFEVVYSDIETSSDLNGQKISGVHAFCFYKDKLVIVYAASKDRWTPPGGGVEDGETAEQAVVREVKHRDKYESSLSSIRWLSSNYRVR